jgi:hypothetical protein
MVATGEVIMDLENGISANPDRVFTVATLDFLHAGGSGYKDFIGVPLVKDMGILREVMTEFFLKKPFEFDDKIDGRWVGVKRPPAAPSGLRAVMGLGALGGEAVFLRELRAAITAAPEHHHADPRDGVIVSDLTKSPDFLAISAAFALFDVVY